MTDDNYYDELMNDDPDYQRSYKKKYDAELYGTLAKMDEADREEYMEVLQDVTYAASSKPSQDARYNLLQARDRIRERQENHTGTPADDLLTYISKQEGKSKKETRAKYRKAMGEEHRTGLSRFDV